jgi:hypothetical protein
MAALVVETVAVPAAHASSHEEAEARQGLAHDALARAIRMLRAAESELDGVLLAIAVGEPPPPERIERVETSYLEARSLAARALECHSASSMRDRSVKRSHR